MLFDSISVPCWLLCLIICLQTPKIQATGLQSVHELGSRNRNDLGSRRRLLGNTVNGVPIEEATRILKSYGLKGIGAIVYAVKSPTCPVEELPASARGQLFVFCHITGIKRNCSFAGGQRGGEHSGMMPLYRLTCENRTCFERLSVAETACVLDKQLDFPVEDSTNGSCLFDYSLVSTNNVSEPFTPDFLRPVGASRTLYDCILALPQDSRVLSSIPCWNGKFRIDTIVELAGDEFVPPGVGFECVWDGKCRGTDGCCEGTDLYEGVFICYLPENDETELASSEAAWRAQLGPLLLACLFIGWCVV